LQTLKSNYDQVNVEADNAKPFSSKSLFPQFGSFLFGSTSINAELLIPVEVYLNEKFTATLLTKDAEGQYCTKGGNHVSIQLETSTGKNITSEVKDNCDGSYVASFTPELVGAAKLVISINGFQIRESPYKIAVLRKYQALNMPDKVVNINGKPYGVAVGQYGIWTVADNSNHCVYVFDAEDQLVGKVGSHGKNVGEFVNPRGVVLDNGNHI